MPNQKDYFSIFRDLFDLQKKEAGLEAAQTDLQNQPKQKNTSNQNADTGPNTSSSSNGSLQGPGINPNAGNSTEGADSLDEDQPDIATKNNLSSERNQSSATISANQSAKTHSASEPYGVDLNTYHQSGQNAETRETAAPAPENTVSENAARPSEYSLTGVPEENPQADTRSSTSDPNNTEEGEAENGVGFGEDIDEAEIPQKQWQNVQDEQPEPSNSNNSITQLKDVGKNTGNIRQRLSQGMKNRLKNWKQGLTNKATAPFKNTAKTFRNIKNIGTWLPKLIAFFGTPPGWVVLGIIAVVLVVGFIILITVAANHALEQQERESAEQGGGGSINLSIEPASADGEHEWYKTSPKIILAADNLGSNKIYYYFSDDETNIQAYEEPFSAPPGDMIMFYFVQDKEGKQVGEIQQMELRNDSTKPKDVKNYIEDFDKDGQDDDTSCARRINLSWVKAYDEHSGIFENTIEARKDTNNGEIVFENVVTEGSVTSYTLSEIQAGRLTTGIKYFFGISSKDYAGHLNNKVYTDGITLDTTGPKNTKLEIISADAPNGDNTKTSQVKVTVSAELIEKFRPLKFKITNTESDLEVEGTEGWQELALDKNEITIDHVLTDGEGEKSVYVQFADKCGNKSPIASDKINLDTSPPTNSTIAIQGSASDQERTKDKKVTLQLSASDQWAPLKMMISNNPVFSNASTTTAWIDFAETYEWTLTSGDGMKTVYARFKDGGGNEITISNAAKDQIILDTKPPTGISIEINSGSSKTNDLLVNLRFTANDDWKPVYFMVSNDVTFSDNSGWIDISKGTHGWYLKGTWNGHRTVYAKFKDGGESVSNITSDSILYEAPPESP